MRPLDKNLGATLPTDMVTKAGIARGGGGAKIEGEGEGSGTSDGEGEKGAGPRAEAITGGRGA